MSDDTFQALRKPFDPDRISWRVGSTTNDKARGMAFAYIDARDVMERLDEVVGPQGWQCEYPHAAAKTVCRLGIQTLDGWVWKSDGAGDTDFEAEKGALSEAFKRAAVRWGIGRYLYDIPATWVEIEAAGKSFKIKEGEYPKLLKVLRQTAGSASTQQAAPASDGGVVAPAFLSEPDATKVMNTLLSNLSGCVSIDELDKYGKSKPFLDSYKQLPQNHRNRVFTAGKARREAIGERAA